MLLSKVNWKCYDGQERKALHAHGVLNYAVMLHGVVILKYSSGHETRFLLVIGMLRLAKMPLETVTWKSCNGRETRAHRVIGILNAVCGFRQKKLCKDGFECNKMIRM